MEPIRQLNRGEQEVANAASRLVELIEEALSVVPQRSTGELDSLEAVADRIERASRDLSVALREFAPKAALPGKRPNSSRDPNRPFDIEFSITSLEIV